MMSFYVVFIIYITSHLQMYNKKTKILVCYIKWFFEDNSLYFLNLHSLNLEYKSESSKERIIDILYSMNSIFK